MFWEAKAFIKAGFCLKAHKWAKKNIVEMKNI